MSLIDLVTFIADIALALTFVVGLIFGIAQVRAVARDRKERLTLETLKNFQTRDFAELLQFVINATFPNNEEELEKLPTEQQVMFIQFAQQMEVLGLLVAENFIDLDLVDKTLGTFVTTTWKKYNTMFSKIRNRDEYIGEYFEWLAEKIDEHLKNTPRVPVHKDDGRTRHTHKH